MDGGFIRLSRSFFQHFYWIQERNFSMAEAWLDLIQLARYDKQPATKLLGNNRKITVKRGEVHASLRFLADRWKWSIDKTKRFIDGNIESGKLSRKVVQGESIIKLCKYELYNPILNGGKYNDEHGSKYADQTAASTNTKKDKEGKERKEIPPLPPKGELYSEVFNEFRKAYKGTKRGLNTELVYFQKKHKDWQQAIPLLLPALQREVEHRKQLAATASFVPGWKNLSTWLNNRCWEQEFSSEDVVGSTIPQALKVTV